VTNSRNNTNNRFSRQPVSQGLLVSLDLLAHPFVFVHTLQRSCRSTGTIHLHSFGHSAPNLFLTLLRLRLLADVRSCERRDTRQLDGVVIARGPAARDIINALPKYNPT